MCRREKKYIYNNVGQFVEKCKNSIFVIFIRLVKIQNLFNLLLSTRKSVAEKKKKDICHLYVYVKYEQNRWLRHCIIKSVFHETKQFNFPEKNVPSQTCLTWVSDHFAVGVEHPSRTTFFSILFLLCHSCTGLWAKPCRAAPTSLKYDFKDACERLDNLFIDTTTLK